MCYIVSTSLFYTLNMLAKYIQSKLVIDLKSILWSICYVALFRHYFQWLQYMYKQYFSTIAQHPSPNSTPWTSWIQAHVSPCCYYCYWLQPINCSLHIVHCVLFWGYFIPCMFFEILLFKRFLSYAYFSIPFCDGHNGLFEVIFYCYMFINHVECK